MIAAVTIAAAVTVLAVADDNSGSVTTAGELKAPWRADEVRRSAVPGPFVEAWDRSANRRTCALLFPLDGGPQMAGAKATWEKTPDDKGWDIFLTGNAGSVEVLALFDKDTQTNRQASTPGFTRTWSDGSVARYAPDVGNLAPGTYDSSTSPFEAVLALPDQACAYRIYDTLGKDHLESVFDRLRLLAR